MKNCEICVSSFNKTTRKEITCLYCQYKACRECVKTYMFQSIQEPHCMNCRVLWNQDYLAMNFSKMFIEKDLRTHREKTLLEREKARLPETQQMIIERRVIQEILCFHPLIQFYETSPARMADLTFYRNKIKEICDDTGVGVPDWVDRLQPQKNTENKIIHKPVRRCIDDDCKGFVMSHNWRCGICQKKLCKRCMVDITATSVAKDHFCKDEDVETTRLLLSNTKPCPGCGLMISKTSGCDQMWCVGCHTTFNWKTLEKSKELVHNPHYFEYLRRNRMDVPRNPGDIPMQPNQVCNEELPSAHILDVMLRSTTLSELQKHIVFYGLSISIHIESIEIVRLEEIEELEPTVLENFRINYLNDMIDEQDWARKLYLRERMHARRRETTDIFRLYLQQYKEVLRLFPRNELLREYKIKRDIPEIQEAIESLEKVVEYCNEAFQKVAKRYSTKEYRISLQEGTVNNQKKQKHTQYK